ncbi:MAG: hypothetical protein AB8B82_05070 [Roseovarius sp.]
MTFAKPIVLLCAAAALSACSEAGPDKSIDRGIDAKHLSQLKAGVWIDPNGCDHWIIDDGVEGYLSARLDKYGKPVCSGTAPPTTAVGDFKNGATSLIGDPI